MTLLSVAVDDHAAGPVRAVLATLPRSFALVVGPAADVQAVDGGEGWPGRVEQAARRHPRAVLVREPSFVPAEQVRELAAACAHMNVRVVLAERWASGALIESFAKRQTRSDPAVLVEGVAGLDLAPREILLAQVRLLHAAFDCTLAPDSFVATRSGYLLTGETVRADVREPLLLIGSGCRAPRARMRRLTAHGESELCLFDGDLARSGEASIADATSERTLPPVYESAHRAAWRRIPSMLDSPNEGTETLELLARDLSIVGRIRW